MRPLPPVSRERAGVFTRSEALSCGWTVAMLRTAVSAGRLVRLRRGVFAVPVPPGPGRADLVRMQHAVAASVAVSGTFVSHLAAASVRGWPVWARVPRACVTRGPGAISGLEEVYLHRVAWSPGDRVGRGAVRMTSVARTVVDVAREFGVESGLVVADAALRCGELGRRDLARGLAAAAGRPGVAHAATVAAHVDARSESALESRSRWHIHRHGLPPPLTQVDIYGVDGRFLGRVDFYWPDQGVVGEADGAAKYRVVEDLRQEQQRARALRRTGLELERWGWVDLGDFAPTAGALREALARGAARTGPRHWFADVHREVVGEGVERPFGAHPGSLSAPV